MHFRWEQRKEKNSIARNATRWDIWTLLTLLSADAKSAVALKPPSSTKVEVHSFLLIHLPRWLCLIHGQLSMSMWYAKRSITSKCFCLFDIRKYSDLSQVPLSHSQKFPPQIQLHVNCFISIVNFHSPNTGTTRIPYIYHILKEIPKAVLKMFLNNVDSDGTEISSRLYFWVFFFKCFSISLFFSVLTVGKYRYMG